MAKNEKLITNEEFGKLYLDPAYYQEIVESYDLLDAGIVEKMVSEPIFYVISVNSMDLPVIEKRKLTAVALYAKKLEEIRTGDQINGN